MSSGPTPAVPLGLSVESTNAGMRTRLINELRRLIDDDRGQDLMEYVLLTLFIGLAGLVALNALGVSINSYYGRSNSSLNLLSDSPAPGSGS